MRTFIAIELSDDIRDALAQAQSHLRYAGADVKWVEKHNIHLTLKFLGEISEEKAAEVAAVLDRVGVVTPSFELTTDGVGVFPTMDYPKVIWVGADKGAREAAALALKIDEALEKIGFEKEKRPFAAHLTIGRVRSGKNKAALVEKIRSSQGPVASSRGPGQRISSVMLFKSTLTPQGSIYTKLHEAKLTV